MNDDGISFRLVTWANVKTLPPSTFFVLHIGTPEEVQACRLARRPEKARRRMERT